MILFQLSIFLMGKKKKNDYDTVSVFKLVKPSGKIPHVDAFFFFLFTCLRVIIATYLYSFQTPKERTPVFISISQKMRRYRKKSLS